MSISIQEMFTIGIGPSSSHTVGPMRASKLFLQYLTTEEVFDKCNNVRVELYGSLALTGVGHGTDRAVLMGLLGESPESVEPQKALSAVESVSNDNELLLGGYKPITFNISTDMVFKHDEFLPGHANGIKYSAYDQTGSLLASRCYYSVGGGFVYDEDNLDTPDTENADIAVKYPFSSGKELSALCNKHGISISTLILENELAWRSKEETEDYLLNVWRTMQTCIDNGCHTEGILPGGLNVKRRASHLYRKLKNAPGEDHDPLKVIDWVNLFALAVNEENAAGGRVVTAPTNGAAGIIPSVLNYFNQFKAECDDQTIVRFLLTAGAVGMLFKQNASISGAEVGCQGEVGVACSMAAAGLAEIMGGTVEQCQVAAEIGMEHNLGLTCDPVGGLVQIPCIERNAMAAVTAINAARLALHGDGSHKVSLDDVIKTMKETGKDMRQQYKETAQGGLAVNIIEC